MLNRPQPHGRDASPEYQRRDGAEKGEQGHSLGSESGTSRGRGGRGGGLQHARTEHVGPCRYCGRDCWMLTADDEYEHPCCRYWIGQYGALRCRGCDTSHRHAQARARRARQRTYRVEDTPPL